MSRAHNLMKCLCVIFFFSLINLAFAGSDKGYINLKIKEHDLNVNLKNKNQVINAILQKLGPFDNKNKCYRMNVDQHQLCFNPINYSVSTYEDGSNYLLALSGYEMTGKYNTGIVFFMSYGASYFSKNLSYGSINGLYGLGEINNPINKNQIKLIENGMHNIWDIKTGFTGHGISEEKTILLYQIGNAAILQKRILEFNSEYDNDGVCGPELKTKCENKNITYRLLEPENYETNNNTLNDIELTFTLKEDNKIIKTTKEIIKFNDKTMSYVLPSNDMLKYMEQNSKEITQNKSVNSSANIAQNIFCVTGLSNQPPDNFLVLRNQPNRSSKWSQTITFKNGDRVEVLGTEGDFYKVRAGNGEIGYSGKAFILPCDKSR